MWFKFTFDTAVDEAMHLPQGGSGTFRFQGTLPDGCYALSDLKNYQFSFRFNGNTFSNQHLASNLDQALVVISQSGRRLRFSNTGSYGGGLFGGSIDFLNPSNPTITFLAFEPSGVQGRLDSYYAGTAHGSFRGDYDTSPLATQGLALPFQRLRAIWEGLHPRWFIKGLE
jgi:hypothetical protein